MNGFTKVLYGLRWRLIFFHDASTKVLFHKGVDELFVKSEDGKKYSILGTLSNKDKHSSYFEFLLEYPTIQYTIHWKQRLNPITTPSTVTDTGFVPIRVPYLYVPFKGLARSADENKTFLDGSPGATTYTWWCAIASYRNYPGSNDIPGPRPTEDYYKGVPNVFLWLCTGFDQQCTKETFIGIRLFINLFLLLN